MLSSMCVRLPCDAARAAVGKRCGRLMLHVSLRWKELAGQYEGKKNWVKKKKERERIVW